MSSYEMGAGAGPAFVGYIDTTVDALRIVRAAMDGIIPRTSRRLSRQECRQLVRSGAVFVFGVLESGIMRWTDGLLWSPSRLQGNFMVYKELIAKSSGRNSPQKFLSGGREQTEVLRQSNFTATASNEGTFKPNGLIKKTITIMVGDSDIHLVCYYKQGDVSSGILGTPRAREDIMALHLSPRDFRIDELRVPPKVSKGPDGRKCIIDESENTVTGQLKATQIPLWTGTQGSEGLEYMNEKPSLQSQRRNRLGDTGADRSTMGHSQSCPPPTAGNPQDQRLYFSPPDASDASQYHHPTRRQPLPVLESDTDHHSIRSKSWHRSPYAHASHARVGNSPEHHRQLSSSRLDGVRRDRISGVTPKMSFERTAEPAASRGQIPANSSSSRSNSLLGTGGTMSEARGRRPGADSSSVTSFNGDQLATSFLSSDSPNASSPETWGLYASYSSSSRCDSSATITAAAYSTYDAHSVSRAPQWLTSRSSTSASANGPLPSSVTSDITNMAVYEGESQAIAPVQSAPLFSHCPPFITPQYPPTDRESDRNRRLLSHDSSYDVEGEARMYSQESWYAD